MKGPQKITAGKFVRRCRYSPYHYDPFQCHPASFGVVCDLVTETAETRADNPKLKIYDKGEWTEVVVVPFDPEHMAPKDAIFIQWEEAECIVISRWQYLIMGVLWPLLYRLYTKPLLGQDTGVRR